MKIELKEKQNCGLHTLGYFCFLVHLNEFETDDTIEETVLREYNIPISWEFDVNFGFAWEKREYYVRFLEPLPDYMAF
jgi:hypothetical protein